MLSFLKLQMDQPAVSQANVRFVPSTTTAKMCPMQHREGTTQACDFSGDGATAGSVSLTTVPADDSHYMFANADLMVHTPICLGSSFAMSTKCCKQLSWQISSVNFLCVFFKHSYRRRGGGGGGGRWVLWEFHLLCLHLISLTAPLIFCCD